MSLPFPNSKSRRNISSLDRAPIDRKNGRAESCTNMPALANFQFELVSYRVNSRWRWRWRWRRRHRRAWGPSCVAREGRKTKGTRQIENTITSFCTWPRGKTNQTVRLRGCEAVASTLTYAPKTSKLTVSRGTVAKKAKRCCIHSFQDNPLSMTEGIRIHRHKNVQTCLFLPARMPKMIMCCLPKNNTAEQFTHLCSLGSRRNDTCKAYFFQNNTRRASVPCGAVL